MGRGRRESERWKWKKGGEWFSGSLPTHPHLDLRAAYLYSPAQKECRASTTPLPPGEELRLHTASVPCARPPAAVCFLMADAPGGGEVPRLIAPPSHPTLDLLDVFDGEVPRLVAPPSHPTLDFVYVIDGEVPAVDPQGTGGPVLVVVAGDPSRGGGGGGGGGEEEEEDEPACAPLPSSSSWFPHAPPSAPPRRARYTDATLSTALQTAGVKPKVARKVSRRERKRTRATPPLSLAQLNLPTFHFPRRPSSSSAASTSWPLRRPRPPPPQPPPPA